MKCIRNHLKKNWKKHILSFDKYKGEKDIGIFLIEYKGALLKKMQHNQFQGFYKLSEDIDLLNYISKYSNKIHYIVFIDGQNYQIIQSKVINSFIERIPKNISYEEGRNIANHTTIILDLKYI